MLFKEIIDLFWKSYETHKYNMKSYWLLKQVGHIVFELDFEGLNYQKKNENLNNLIMNWFFTLFSHQGIFQNIVLAHSISQKWPTWGIGSKQFS
jgi:hypothetical protein